MPAAFRLSARSVEPGYELPVVASPRRRVGVDYARLLVADKQAKGMLFNCPLRIMGDNLQALVSEGSYYSREYLPLIAQMRFAEGIGRRVETAIFSSLLLFLVPCLQQLAVKRAAELIIRQIEHEGVAFFPCFTLAHAMYMQISRDPKTDRCTIRIFNLGDGIQQFHTRCNSRKWQSMYEVEGVQLGASSTCLNVKRVIQLLCLRSVLHKKIPTVASVYLWAQSLGQPVYSSWRAAQAPQKSGNCTHKSVLAFMRNMLSNAAYAAARARLLKDSAQGWSSLPHWPLHTYLTGNLQAKAASAAEKALSAARQAELLQEAAAAAWFACTPHRADVFLGLFHGLLRHQRTFCLAYRPDLRTFAVALGCNYRYRIMPLSWATDGSFSVRGIGTGYRALAEVVDDLLALDYCPTQFATADKIDLFRKEVYP